MKPAAIRTLIVIGLAAALAACGSDSAAPVDDNREAGGEVLEGSITDDMIPLDQLKSQGQSAEPEGEEGASASTSNESESDAAPDEEPSEETGDEPAAE